MEFHRARNDANGSPRFILWFGELTTEVESASRLLLTGRMHELKCRLRGVFPGATVYRGRDFGGGLVFSSYLGHSQMQEKVEKHLSDINRQQEHAIENLVLTVDNDGQTYQERLSIGRLNDFEAMKHIVRQCAYRQIREGCDNPRIDDEAVILTAAKQLLANIREHLEQLA